MGPGAGRAALLLPRLRPEPGGSAAGGVERAACVSPVLAEAEAEAVAAGWILDFACYSMCRHFCEGSPTDFERSRELALTVIKGLHRIEEHQVKTVCLCELLAYVSEGKELGSYSEGGLKRSPLENALLVWTSFLKTQSKQDKFFEYIKRLIQIQAVAVYMEKGYNKEAEEVLERIFPESLSNEPFHMKLSAVVKEKDPRHPFLQRFSFSVLNEKIKSYITNFLNEDSNNFLLKAAAEEVKTKLKTGVPKQYYNTATISITYENNQKMTNRSSEQGYSLADQTFLNPEQEQSYLRQKHKKHRKQSTPGRNALVTTENDQQVCLPTGQKKQRWRWEDDRKLKKGIHKFGVGNWTKILQHYDFNHRTSVMLKDRWRTMVRSGMI